MRYCGYVRVSDKEQVKKGFSIEAQTEALEQWCDDGGHRLVRVFSEPGRSGTKPSKEARPEFERAIAFVLAGWADGLVVKWIDRFSRNVEDFLRVRSQLYSAGRQLITISEPMLNGDPGDPITRYISTAIMNAYQLQAELSGLKASQGRERRAKQGQYPGTLPVGYTRNGKLITPDEQAAPVITTSFCEFSTGKYTLDTWLIESQKFGYSSQRGNPITKSGWHRIFRNKFYTGRFTWKDDEYQGDYEPLVSVTTFEAVQEILDSHSTGDSFRRHFWLLSGLLWSDVHHKLMNGALIKERFAYYRATAAGQSEHNVKADDIEQRVIAQLDKIRWNRERLYSLPEHLRVAFQMSTNVGEIYQYLQTKTERKDFLNMIFFKRGIRVAVGGAIMGIDVLPDFVG
jgi:DNA invertase Pin-like site-specific DNA recombinase